MTRGLPSPADRPDLYDGFDGLDHPAGWENPVQIPERLRTLMNPIPLICATFTPCEHRPDAHSLRYEFRHLVNAGVIAAERYDEFVAFVDRSGGIAPAMQKLRSGSPLS